MLFINRRNKHKHREKVTTAKRSRVCAWALGCERCAFSCARLSSCPDCPWHPPWSMHMLPLSHTLWTCLSQKATGSWRAYSNPIAGISKVLTECCSRYELQHFMQQWVPWLNNRGSSSALDCKTEHETVSMRMHLAVATEQRLLSVFHFTGPCPSPLGLRLHFLWPYTLSPPERTEVNVLN